MHIACNSDSYIQINNVFYGRDDAGGTVCPHRFSNHTYDDTCTTDNTADDAVRQLCVGNRQCEIDVQGDILDTLNDNSANPCPNEFMYLRVQYSCSLFIEGKKCGRTGRESSV